MPVRRDPKLNAVIQGTKHWLQRRNDKLIYEGFIEASSRGARYVLLVEKMKIGREEKRL